MEATIRTNPRARRITLRLDKTGAPVVTVPWFTPKWFVNRFIASQADWITQSQRKLRQAQSQFFSDASVSLFGKSYQLAIKSTTGASSVKIQGKNLAVSLHSGKKTAQVIETFLKNTASHYILPRVHQLAKKMGVDFTRVTLRAQTTRWGSCSSTGSLNFNWKLVHFTPAIIDSVLIHELAHRKHLNHSAEFWRFVEQFDAQYRVHRGWLKRQGIGVV